MTRRWPKTDGATSRRMAKVRPLDTTPERVVRRIVSGLSYRYRLNVTTLPGRPDLVLRRLRKVIFVHGCFWHRHSCRRGQSRPRSNVKLWATKFERNRQRDISNRRLLRQAGWDVLVLWECQLSDTARVVQRISRFLSQVPLGFPATGSEGGRSCPSCHCPLQL